MNINIKSDLNKVNKTKCLEGIVPANEIRTKQVRTEQNWNGYCNVDFVFTLDPTSASFICGIKVIFSTMNLYLFFKCIPSDFKFLSSLWFDMGSICYLCAITCTVTEVASGIVNAGNKEIQVRVW
jgi:hypothetical protein